LLSPREGACESFSGGVVGVTDGDTLSVMKDRTAVKIRLHGIDCPEKGQLFTNRAKQFTSSLAFEKDVRVEAKGQDRYGRTIAEVFLQDGRNLNQEIVKAGLASWSRRYVPNDKELKKLESEAREAKRDCDVIPSPVAPWEYRNG